MAAVGVEHPVRHAVVVLNWNGRAWLERFLVAVEATTPETVALVVADNGSTDDSADYVAAHHPRVHFLAMDQNRGYAGGYNTALRHLRAQWPELDLAVLMNSDIEPLPLW
ncbi:MAG: glycosyltransferase, partial [Schleiferiaceae bacterium]|nr:glycosyltransferase [Schleiferiaceae bacterium]